MRAQFDQGLVVIPWCILLLACSGAGEQTPGTPTSGGSTGSGAVATAGGAGSGATTGGMSAALGGAAPSGGTAPDAGTNAGGTPQAGTSGVALGGMLNGSGGGPQTSSGGGGQAGSAGNVGTGGGTPAASAVGAATTPVMPGAWKCPDGVSGSPMLTNVTPTRVTGVPPEDGFSGTQGSGGMGGAGGMNGSAGMNGTAGMSGIGGLGSFGGFGGIGVGLIGGNLEGPVWIGDALYLSELSSSAYDDTNTRIAKARILKVTSDDMVSVAIADSGSNGLAVDGAGALIAAVHKDGTLTRFSLAGGAPSYVATGYMGLRFNAPNDLVIRSDGNIYFSDPEYQAPTPAPQAAPRMYRVTPAGEVIAFEDAFMNPNGVTLSLDEAWLYVAAARGRRYPLAADGTVGAGEDFAPTSGVDGIAIDCAGNLYVARGREVAVYDAAATSLGSIRVPDVLSVTNLAFGGAERKTLYITGQGPRRGLFKVTLDIPGRPY